MNHLFVLGSSFDDCFSNLSKVLKRCMEKNLTLNLKNCHFMVKKWPVLRHVISEEGVEVNKTEANLIVNLLLPICMKEVRSF